MEYYYSISKFKTFNLGQVKEVFPDNFKIETVNDKNSLIVTTLIDSDAEIFITVQRECDRIFFLTGEQLDPQFREKKYDNGTKICQQCITSDSYIIDKIPENIARQRWSVPLTVQLRLWQLTKSLYLPLSAKINLLFQIIEITFSNTQNSTNYPEYTCSDNPPVSMTESLLLRNLVSHGGESMRSEQLKKYCRFLGIKENFYDATNTVATKAIEGRVSILENEARRVISEQISLNKKS
jgi:hypothetical protein